MNCPRCSGLLVPETVHDGALSAALLRCVNCGRVGEAMATPISDQEASPKGPRRCAHCKRPAIPWQVLCAPHRKKWRVYMTHRKLRLAVKAKGFTAVMAEVKERLLKIEAQRNFLLTNRKTLGG